VPLRMERSAQAKRVARLRSPLVLACFINFMRGNLQSGSVTVDCTENVTARPTARCFWRTVPAHWRSDDVLHDACGGFLCAL
jgi:hypothetical protein